MEMEITTGKSLSPPRTLVYSPHKMGKTSFAMKAPKPLFMITEDGFGGREAAYLPLIKTYQDFLDQCKYLSENPNHGYETLVFDNVSFFESMVYKQVMQDKPTTDKGKPVTDITDYGYGQGYKMALPYWERFFDSLNWLRDNQNMMIIIIGHAHVTRFDDPAGEPYNRYELDLYKGIDDLLERSVDNIFFINDQTAVTKTEVGFGNEVKRGVQGQRLIYTEKQAAFDAGNRYDLPAQIPFDKDGVRVWETLVQHIPYLNNKYGNKGE